MLNSQKRRFPAWAVPIGPAITLAPLRRVLRGGPAIRFTETMERKGTAALTRQYAQSLVSYQAFPGDKQISREWSGPR